MKQVNLLLHLWLLTDRLNPLWNRNKRRIILTKKVNNKNYYLKQNNLVDLRVKKILQLVNNKYRNSLDRIFKLALLLQYQSRRCNKDNMLWNQLNNKYRLTILNHQSSSLLQVKKQLNITPILKYFKMNKEEIDI